MGRARGPPRRAIGEAGRGAGIAMISVPMTFGGPIGVGLLISGPISDDSFSLVCVLGPTLISVFLLGIRALINTTIVTANETQRIVKTRPLPFLPAKTVSEADLHSLAGRNSLT